MTLNPLSASRDTPGAPDPAALCTSFMVRSLSRKISQLYDETLAPSGLKSTQFSLLLQARTAPAGEPMTVSVLAQHLNTDRTTLSRNLRILQEAGCIELVAGQDARSRGIVVTSHGEAAFRQAAALWRQAQARVREICGEDTVAELQNVVQRMLAELAAGGRA